MTNEPIKISWSALLRWEECGHKFYRHAQRQKSVITDGRNFIQGSVCDKIMRQWLNEDDPQPGGMRKYIDEALGYYARDNEEYVIKWRGDPRDDFDKVRKFCYDCIEPLEAVLFEHVIPYDYDPAGRFSVPIRVPSLSGDLIEVTLFGEWDLLVRDHNQDYHVMDLKATANEQYIQGKTLAQLTFYALAVGSMFKDLSQPKSTAFITPALKTKFVPITVTDRDKQVLMSRIVKFVHGIERDSFLPEPGNHCFGCGVKHVCDYWNPQAKEDASGKKRVSLKSAANFRNELKDGGTGPS